MKALIVDDEVDSRQSLRKIIEMYVPELQVAGEADDLPEAVKLINKLNPEIVFLDIEMPGYSGLEILDMINPDQYKFDIIFVTAYSEFAIQAFHVSAVDYLLKPLQIEQLVAAVKKVQKKNTDKHDRQNYQILKANMDPSNKVVKVAVPFSDGIKFISSDQIIYLKADGPYSEIILKNGSKELVSRHLKEFERILLRAGFFRNHRSYLINLNEVSQFVRKDGGYLLMSNHDQLPISSDKKEELVSAIENI